MEQTVSLTAADKDDFKRLWDNALAAYEKETGRNLLSDRTLRDLKSVDALIDRIEAEGGSFAGWRNKHPKLWSRVSTCLKPIVNIGTIAKDVITSTPFFAASAVLCAVLYVVKAGDRVAEAYDWIEAVFGELQEFADRLNLYLKNELDTVLEKKITAILAFFLKVLGRQDSRFGGGGHRVLTSHRSEHLVSRGSFRQYLRVVFLGSDDKTKKIVDDLNESLKSEQSYVIAATYASATTAVRDGKSILSKVDAIDQGISKNSEALSNIQGNLEGSLVREVTKEDEELIQHSLESLAVDRTFELFAELRKRLLSGTGAWLEKEALFTAWTEQKIPILWIFGGPGSGKSHLSTWTINHLEALYAQDQGNPSGVTVAFFYVKENEAQLRDANTILKTLAWQIAQVDPVFKKHAVEVCKSKRKIINSEETWSNLFLDFYKPVRTVDRSAIIVIDGLDEAPKPVRQTILGFCKDLIVQDPSGVRPRIQVAVVGRITLKGDMEFEREEKFIEVSREKNRNDIDKYIEKRLSELELLKKLEQLDKAETRKVQKQRAKPIAPTVRKKLKDKILASADGIFLWAQLLLDQIQKKEASEIEKILNSPPQSLEDMIRHVFERLAAEEDELETIKKLLSWMAYARRPLWFGEIDLILSLPSQSPNLLLWDAFLGKFASIFQLRFPEDYIEDVKDDEQSPVIATNEPQQDPDVGEQVTDDKQKSVDEDSNEVEEADIDAKEDLSGDEDEDQGDADENDDNFKLFDVGADRGLEALAMGVSSDDSRYIHAYSDFQLRTVVTFSHQQFRDFLVPQQERAPMDLDIDNKRSPIDITITCFDILRLGHSERQDSRYLADYPSRNFIHHLESIDNASVIVEDKRRIIEGLYWIFHELAGIRALIFAPPDSDSPAWDEYWSTWVAVDNHTNAVRSWFEQIDTVPDTFDEEAVAWMKAAAVSTKRLLQPWVENLARIWLEKTGFDDPAYMDKSERVVWLMHGLLSLDDEGIVTKDLKDFAYYQLDFSGLSIEKIESLASYAPTKNTPHWHTGLAWILMEAWYNEPAISHFKEALTMEPEAWLPKEGLARIYGSQGIYPEAIRLMQEAYDSLPSNFAFVGGFLLPRIAEWKREIGDRHGAYDAARKGWIAEPSSPLAQFHYLKALDDEGYSEYLIETLRYLADTQWILETPMSYFTRLLIQNYPVFDIVGRAFHAAGKPVFIVDAMDKTLDVITNTKDEFMKMYLHGQVALFKYEYDAQVEPPTKLFEHALKLTAAGNGLTKKQKQWSQNVYGNVLAQLYYDSAVESQRSGMNTWAYTSKLKKMATVTNTTTEDVEDAFDFYGTGYASMLWGCWLREYESAEASIWRKCFRARILEELELLDDNDPTNDMKGLHTLAITLLHLGDDTNAAAILAVVFKPLEDIRAAYGSGEDGEDEDLDGQNSASNESNPETQNSDVQVVDQEGVGEKGEETTVKNTGMTEPKKDAAELSEKGGSSAKLDEGEPEAAGDLSSVASRCLTPVTDAEGEPTSIDNNEVPISESNTGDPPADLNSTTSDSLVDAAPIKTADGRLVLSLAPRWIHECDGPCSTNYWHYTELYICKICLGKKFCGDCINLVKAGTLVRRVCSPHHDWYQAWPIPEPKWSEVAEEVDEHLVIRPEWLEKIRAEWL